MNIFEKIETQLKNNKFVLYMKGTPDNPKCGYSEQVSNIVKLFNKKILFIDVIDNNEFRVNLPKYSKWPTFPQLWINNNLIGGCDIITEMYNNGELKKLFT